MSDKYRNLWVFVATWLVAAIHWLLGHHETALEWLALTPLFLMVWGLSALLAGPERRDIARHMTERERQQLNAMVRQFGKGWGIPVALPFLVLFLAFVLSGGNETAHMATLVAALILALPIGVWRTRSWRRSWSQFLYETDYARAKYGPGGRASESGSA